MTRVLGLIVSTLFLTQNLYAQTEVQTTIEKVAPAKSPWDVTVNLTPLFKFNGSFEIGIGYDVANKLNTELFYSRNNMSNTTASGFVLIESSTTASAYGLRLNFFPFSDVKEAGFFTSALLSQVNLKTSATASLMGDSLSTGLQGQHVGQQIFMGYQFTPQKTDDRLNITSRVGIGYGNGENYGIRAGWKEYEVRNSVQFEGTFVITYL